MVKSLYEHLNKLSDPPKKRFVENFTGRELDDKVWNFHKNNSSSTILPLDEIDGGIKLDCAGTAGFDFLSHNNICNFKSNACSVIWNCKVNVGSQWGCGLGSDKSDVDNSTVYLSGTTSATIKMYTWNSAGQDGGVGTSLGFKGNRVYHKYQCDSLSTGTQGSIDNVLEASQTAKVLNTDMQPWAYVYNATTELQVNYCEAWNT
tara:strand:+ start:55 stop:666 length:612 start_codon:yes stop_codon:yes gene_type:complete